MVGDVNEDCVLGCRFKIRMRKLCDINSHVDSEVGSQTEATVAREATADKYNDMRRGYDIQCANSESKDTTYLPSCKTYKTALSQARIIHLVYVDTTC